MIASLILEAQLPDNQKHSRWDTLLLDANLATMVGGYGIIERGAIGIAGGRIAWVGDASVLPDKPKKIAREVHELGGCWLTPGLVDCHTHMVYAGDRAHEFALRRAGKSYKEIAEAGGGILATVRATREASEEALFAQSAKRLEYFLREGVTTTEIKSGYGLDAKTEMKMLRVARALGERYGLRVRTTFLGAHTLPPEYAGNHDAYIAMLCNELLPRVARDKLADAVDGFCESIGFTPAQIGRLFETAQSLGLPVKLHAEQLSNSGGAALAATYGALSADHLEYASNAGIMAMADAGTVAVLLPGAFYMLNETRKPPVELLRTHGVPIALASDCNPGTSPVLSLLLMLNMGCVLFGLTPQEALSAVTVNAAAALGLREECGTLEIGKAADIAVWDIAHPDALAYYAGFNPCRGVYRGGTFHEGAHG